MASWLAGRSILVHGNPQDASTFEWENHHLKITYLKIIKDDLSIAMTEKEKHRSYSSSFLRNPQVLMKRPATDLHHEL